ncbi:uncharacterized protein LOC110691595 isoform X1 [Chenopodium quinoa]|uniref:uncharacterized protein LOC110691595 isoform X1 n=2 Tax=Chenopodium quinoa TaxID=63459 RepID=UPI000B77F7FA|nr:uncharacterized protein LOC110691595 isoform X1 [Chenopodium quinoa]
MHYFCILFYASISRSRSINMAIQQSQEQTSSSQDVALQATSSKKRSRGPSKAIQSSKPMVLEFNDYDLPTSEWELVYGKQIGACAKRLDITVNEYAKIDKVDRENIWEETKRMFHIEDPSGERQKRFHSVVASRFSCHKSNLRARIITFKNPYPATSPKANMKPWEVYEGYFTEEKWKRFEIYSKSAEFKEKSEKGKENVKLNKCRHHLGRNSFQRARIILNKQKRLENRFPALAESSTTGNTSQSSTSTGSIFDRRALEWGLAHEKRLPDGTWGIDPKDTETIRIANVVVSHSLSKQINLLELQISGHLINFFYVFSNRKRTCKNNQRNLRKESVNNQSEALMPLLWHLGKRTIVDL